jgi:hypothetical protein
MMSGWPQGGSSLLRSGNAVCCAPIGGHDDNVNHRIAVVFKKYLEREFMFRDPWKKNYILYLIFYILF